MEGKREAIKKVIFPWFFFAGGMPFAYIGFLIPFISVKNMEICLPFAIIFFYLQVIMGLLAAVVFSVLGFVFVAISMWFIVPVIMLFNQFFKFLNSKLVYRSKGKLYSENRMAQKVRKKDPLFSIQSFFGGVQNKLYAIHFADKRNQVNAFSDLDLSEYLKKYEKVVDIETLSLSMDLYRVKKGIQIATVRAELLLREFKDNKIKNRKEFLKLQLEKSEHCKTGGLCSVYFKMYKMWR